MTNFPKTSGPAPVRVAPKSTKVQKQLYVGAGVSQPEPRKKTAKEIADEHKAARKKREMQRQSKQLKELSGQASSFLFLHSLMFVFHVLVSNCT
jgi:hypothetical protein